MRQYSVRKTLFFIGMVISIAFAVSITLFFRNNMMALLKQREEDYIMRYQAQTMNILQRDTDNLSLSLRDWVSQGNTYNFVNRRSPGEKAAMLQMNSVFLMRLDYAAIIANNGFVSERFFDYKNNVEHETIPHAENIKTVSRWLYRETQFRYGSIGPNGNVFDTLSETQCSGFVSAGGYAYYFTAAPIMTPRNDKTSNGSMIFARRVTNESLESKEFGSKNDESDTQVSVYVIPPQDLKEDSDYGEIKYIDNGSGIVIRDIIPTIDDSVVILATTQKRAMYQRSIAMIQTLSVIVFIFSCLLSIALMSTMEIWLLRPILLLSNKVSNLDYDLPPSDIPTFRGEELNVLSVSIRELLRRVSDHRSFIEEQNTQLSIQNKMLDTLANYDPHTGLPNKNKLGVIMNNRIAEAKDRGHLVGLMYIHITNFSLINNARGQATSDLLLIAVVNRLSSIFGIHDNNSVASFGREYFALTTTGMDKDEILMSAYSLLSLFNEPYAIDNHEILVNIAVGIAVAPIDGDKFEELDACANIAMNNARESSDSSSFLFFDHTQLETVISKYNRIADIKKGLEGGEFKVVFQPKVDMDTNLITSAEALVRWHSKSGMIPPSLFIPDACETGLIVPLSWEILRMSLTSNSRFSSEFNMPFSVGINVPNNVLLHSDFITVLTEILSQTGLSPNQVNVELTEDVLVNDFKKCNARMNALNKMGIQISIDDFGTGYASLQYLSKMPFNWMKIDKTFVDGLPDRPEEMAIIAASVGIARGLGMRVVLEGVESARQWNMIAEQNYCDQIQGYVVSKPLEEEEFIRFVSEWNSKGIKRYEAILDDYGFS